MSHKIQCKIRPTPEALERVLQVVRVRGFLVNALSAEQEEAALRIDLRLAGGRSVDNLVRQLEKLVGMESVLCLSSLRDCRKAMAVGA